MSIVVGHNSCKGRISHKLETKVKMTPLET
jgi:hypothetical protein